MHGNGIDAGSNSGWYGGDPTLQRWHQPLGSTISARLLAELVVERLRTIAGSCPTIVGDCAVDVDVELGMVRVRHGRWSATLAPLAAQLAHTPPEGWATVVDRELERWLKAVTGVRRQSHNDDGGCVPPDSASLVLRLTTADGAPGRALRPAFGTVVWELARDLGAGGRAGLGAGGSDDVSIGFEPDAGNEQFWARIAAETVDRHEAQWASLPLDSTMAVILSGPHVSALLYDHDRLRDRVETQAGGDGLRVTVTTNSLMLVTAEGESIRATADVVAESLRRFASGRRHFDPFTVHLQDTNASCNGLTLIDPSGTP